MPWKETRVVDERMRFVMRVDAGERVSDLCREYGISRKTGHKFLRRYRGGGVEALQDLRRAPHRVARRTEPSVEKAIVALRREHPTWGSKKLRDVFDRQEPAVRFPARSTFDEILKRHGLVSERKKRVRVPPYTAPLAHATAPNTLWCADFKGQFQTGDGRFCYPLTVSDAFSRYILSCEALASTALDPVVETFGLVFEQFGLPEAIRTDNGAPFASRGLFGLTRLSALWLAFGIRHERIEKGHPEQNGVHERMHLTLKQDTIRPAGANLLQQQERFDQFLLVFNHERPHEALDMRRPAEIYARSSRSLQPLSLEYPLHDEVRRVTPDGHLIIGRRGRLFLSSALGGFPVGLREVQDDILLVTFASLDLGLLDLRKRIIRRFDLEPLSAA